MSDILVSTTDLHVHFQVSDGFWKKRPLKAVDGVSMEIPSGSTFALVGESGCGKTTFGRALLRLAPVTSGSVMYDGQDITNFSDKEMRPLRRQMQIIFQDPYSSLNSRMKVRDIVLEPYYTHEPGMTCAALDERAARLLEAVGLEPDAMGRYPHQFSGGQRQRISIARTLALHPRFIVCDEAVSALDVSIQAQILNLLADLQDTNGFTYLFITHNLPVVQHFADRVAVMFLGRVVESGPVAAIFASPMHPYTKFLIAAAPEPNPHTREEPRVILSGDMPSPLNAPPGCRFHTRCPYADSLCKSFDPPLVERDGRFVACVRPLA